MTGGIVYLASPYSHADPSVRIMRYKMACATAACMIKRGQRVFSPIVNSHPLRKYGLDGDWRSWEEYDRLFLDLCDTLAVLMIPGWKESEGVQHEIEYASSLHKDILFLEAPECNGGDQ